MTTTGTAGLRTEFTLVFGPSRGTFGCLWTQVVSVLLNNSPEHIEAPATHGAFPAPAGVVVYPPRRTSVRKGWVAAKHRGHQRSGDDVWPQAS